MRICQGDYTYPQNEAISTNHQRREAKAIVRTDSLPIVRVILDLSTELGTETTFYSIDIHCTYTTRSEPSSELAGTLVLMFVTKCSCLQGPWLQLFSGTMSKPNMVVSTSLTDCTGALQRHDWANYRYGCNHAHNDRTNDHCLPWRWGRRQGEANDGAQPFRDDTS
jgi:hypothetical protein